MEQSQQRDPLDALFRELLARKPAGWSVVQGADGLVIRAPDRRVGKARIRVWRGTYSVMFHSRQQGIWTDSSTWPVSPGVAVPILAWVESVLQSATAGESAQSAAEPGAAADTGPELQ